MAEKLQEYTFGRGSNYPWDEWLDGSPWRLIRGEDFDAKVTSLQSAAHTAAKDRGLSLHTTKEDDDSVVIQAYTPTDEEKKLKAAKKSASRKKAAPKAKAKASTKAATEASDES